MLVIPQPPKPPKFDKKVTFVEAVKDSSGEATLRYIEQQAYRLPDFSTLWAFPFPSMEIPLRVARSKFEADKARYLATGELPKDE